MRFRGLARGEAERNRYTDYMRLAVPEPSEPKAETR